MRIERISYARLVSDEYGYGNRRMSAEATLDEGENPADAMEGLSRFVHARIVEDKEPPEEGPEPGVDHSDDPIALPESIAEAMRLGPRTLVISLHEHGQPWGARLFRNTQESPDFWGWGHSLTEAIEALQKSLEEMPF